VKVDLIMASSLILPIQWIPTSDISPYSEETLAKIRLVQAGLIYKDEISFVLQLNELQLTGLAQGRVMPYSERLVTTQAGHGWVGAAVTILVECLDGYVLQRRAMNISEPGQIYPICESLSMEDVDDAGVLHITAGAARGLREELGIEVALSDLIPGNACTVQGNLVACFSVSLPISFEGICASWSTATHRDEGTPVLFSLFEHQRIVSRTIPEHYFTAANLAPFLNSDLVAR
jgi:hypothetical protein